MHDGKLTHSRNRACFVVPQCVLNVESPLLYVSQSRIATDNVAGSQFTAVHNVKLNGGYAVVATPEIRGRQPTLGQKRQSCFIEALDVPSCIDVPHVITVPRVNNTAIGRAVCRCS